MLSAARAWAGGEDQFGRSEALLAMSEADQQDWMGRYPQAARSCDGDALAELAEELR